MSWKITINAVTQARLRELNREAILFGQDEAFQAGVKDLEAQLSADPFSVGEIRHHLAGGQPFHVGAKAPAVILFAIYEAERVVWITRVDRLASPSE